MRREWDGPVSARPSTRYDETIARFEFDGFVIKLQPESPFQNVSDVPDVTPFRVFQSPFELDQA